MVRQFNNKIHKLIMLLMFMVIALFVAIIAYNHSTNVHASEANKVYFKDTKVETNDSNIIIADLVVEGHSGDVVEVTYHTEGATAIQGIDYNMASSTVKLTIDSTGLITHKISIKCLNDKTTREKLRVYEEKDGNVIEYGRYFNLKIDNATNANIDANKSVCKCYLSYDYKVSATTGALDEFNIETAYLNDYKNMQFKSHAGKDEIDGQETWKTWKNGVSFDNDTSKRWTSAFINEGFASAYTSFMIEVITNYMITSGNQVQILGGGKEFMDNYQKKVDAKGMYLYLAINPDTSGKNKIDGKAMNIIDSGKNPYDKDSALANVTERHTHAETKILYWIQPNKTWYAGNNSLVNSTFYKIDPYNGILDSGVSVFNDNSEFDRTIKNFALFLSLVDDKTPEIIGEYVDDSTYSIDGKLKIYLRFNEPVYSSKTNTVNNSNLEVKINNGSTSYYAQYVDGNYTDTLVYELTPPKTNISSMTYQLLKDDIGDMAYNLNTYKKVDNNKLPESITTVPRSITLTNGNINLTKPVIGVDIEKSTKPTNIYNLMMSINDNGEKDIDTGTIYYSWTNSEYFLDPENPNSYSNSHTLTKEELGSFNITLAKNASEGITSGTYYLQALAVSDYGLKDVKTFGPYVLDGEEPVIVNKPLTVNDLQNKEYELEFQNKESNAGVKNITLRADVKSSGGSTITKYLDLVKNGEIISDLRDYVSVTHGSSSSTYKYKSNINQSATNKDNFIISLMGLNPRIELSVSFIVTDESGNVVTSNSINTVYDRRNQFNATVTIPSPSSGSSDGYVKITDINAPHDAYDISNIVNNKTITFEVTSSADKASIGNGVVFSVDVNGKTIEASSTSPYKIQLSDLGPGFYEIIPKISGVSTTTGTEYDLVSNTISFYLTNGKEDETSNYTRINNNLELINKVFQLTDTSYYYLDATNTVVLKQQYGAYTDPETSKLVGGSTSPSFSSVYEAKNYIKYMEYQDMYLVKITANIANLLNTGAGTTTYVKAQGETVIAQEGQLWIRYKRNNWTSGSTAYGWAFYYYGNGQVADGININGLSANLNNALNAVVNTITSAGKNVYLVTDDTINQRTGEPYLSESQMHINEETATSSKMGTTYLVNPTYAGDKKLYSNYVIVGSTEYALATNMKLSVTSNTALYYKYAGEGSWIKLAANDGDILCELLKNNDTGYYIFREYGDYGVSEYGVYIDKTIPRLRVSIEGNGTQSEMDLDNQILKFTGEKFTIKSITEIDPYGYVAIYSYPSKKLIKVLYKNDITADDINGYQLSGGNYYVQVGDRSGNIVTYSVLLATSSLDVTVAENESQTAVVVKVLNREEDEIYAYEVFVNETLVTSEYRQTRMFRDPGIYRIIIVDIYGNTFEKVIEHNLQTPKIEWYYQNENGGYSKYDQSNIENMSIVVDGSSKRVANVYTSSLLRLKFISNYNDGNIKFEINDLSSGEYAYSEMAGTISINVLSGFSIRVWYEDYPDNDYTYYIRIDNESPTISATFRGTSYYGDVTYESNKVVETSTFDCIDYSKYNVGDPISVDKLSYKTTGLLGERSFLNGDIINSNHITLKINDSSEIKSYSVSKDGQILSVSLTVNNEIIIRDYGSYVITVTDMLENTTVFKFINTNNVIATANVDGNSINRNINSYGHDYISVSPIYPGQTSILVKTSENKATYIVNFDGKLLTYGQYYCILNQSENKSCEFRENPNFSIDISSDIIKENHWYSMITTNDYVIYVMITNNLPVYKVECKEAKLNVELSYMPNKSLIPNRFIADLSKENPSIDLCTGDQDVEIKDYSKYIYISKDLTIKDNVSENITKIEVGFKDNPNIEEFETIYENHSFVKDFIGTDDGFYKIVVYNKYGNQTVYLISKIDSLKYIVYSKYLDGTATEFTTNDGTIYSNSYIELVVFSDEVRFEVNDEVFEGTADSGAITLGLDRRGNYTVKAISTNGIYEEFSFVIDSDYAFEYKESWITGYNEKALLKDQGYTNTLLSISLDSNIKYIAYTYGDNKIVRLYDDISDDKIIDLNSLNKAIGKDGIGTYVVYFRNIYGDVVSKTIHYSNVASLELSRKTVDSQKSFEPYDINLAIEKNFYSNYVLRFSTSSNNYKFIVDGNEISLEEPKTIEFSNSSGNGSFGYHVSYLDEYGNFIEFEAELYRADVLIDTSAMNEITLNNSIYTKDNVKILFDDNLKATVSINGLNPVDYESGYTYYKDGKYEFIVEDIAGNRNVYTINHKSVNKFTLTDSATGQNVIIGGVINNSSVLFTSFDDSTIKSVFKNGVKVSDFNSNSFTTTGYWEALIEDSIGNTSYVGFYVINNSLSSFAYNAPFDYTISEVWYTNKQGQRVLLEQKGDSVDLVENGDYALVVTSKESTSSFNFSVSIDDTLPQAKLVGVENGGTTARNVHLSGLKKGDIVEIYRNGVLISRTDVTLSNNPPEITEGGKYKVVITNLAGAQIEYNFTRKQIANSATSVFIIIVCFVAIAGIGIGLIYHTRLKTDS